MSTEIEARARLFDAIEGGSLFWSRQIIEFGASAVVEKIDGGGYDRVKYERIITRIRSISAEEILETIGATDSQFIYPATDDWPDSLEDLVCPPIALIVRGDISLLKCPQSYMVVKKIHEAIACTNSNIIPKHLLFICNRIFYCQGTMAKNKSFV